MSEHVPEPARRLSPLGFVENVVAGLLVAATVVDIVAEVVFRYVLHNSLSWSTEVATDLLVWITFVGLAIGVRERAHVALNLLEAKVPARYRPVLTALQGLAFAVFLVIGLVGGVEYISDQMPIRSPSGIPLWVVVTAIPVGCALALVHLAAQAYAAVRAHRDRPADSHTDVPARTASDAS